MFYKIKIKNPVMGVPITFLYKYNPSQFEILGITENADYLKSLYINGCQKYDRPYINGKRIYSRLLIKRKQVMDTNGVMKKYKIKIKNPVMGVPITFLDKYCPSQFEIVAQMANTNVDKYNFGYPFVFGKKKYARILIRKISN